MQTKPYKDLYSLVSALAGVNSFTDDEKKNIVNFINRRYLQAYNMSPNWVRYLTVGEERKVSSFKVSGFSGVYDYQNEEYYKYGKTSVGIEVFVPINQINSLNSEFIFYRPKTEGGIYENRWVWGRSAYSKDAQGFVYLPTGFQLNLFAVSADKDANGAY